MSPATKPTRSDSVLTERQGHFPEGQKIAVHKTTVTTGLLVFLMLTVLFVSFPLARGTLKGFDRRAVEIQAPVTLQRNSPPSAEAPVTAAAPVSDATSAAPSGDNCPAAASAQKDHLTLAGATLPPSKSAADSYGAFPVGTGYFTQQHTVGFTTEEKGQPPDRPDNNASLCGQRK